jgi:hypothetical protein
MAMRLKWLREMVRNSLVGVRHIVTGDNHSDIFTKLLPATKHAEFRAILMGTTTDTTKYQPFGN